MPGLLGLVFTSSHTNALRWDQNVLFMYLRLLLSDHLFMSVLYKVNCFWDPSIQIKGQRFSINLLWIFQWVMILSLPCFKFCPQGHLRSSIPSVWNFSSWIIWRNPLNHIPSSSLQASCSKLLMQCWNRTLYFHSWIAYAQSCAVHFITLGLLPVRGLGWKINSSTLDQVHIDINHENVAPKITEKATWAAI